MKNNLLNWLIFLALCLIWGSSFIMMKTAMHTLTAFEVASLRIFSASIVMLPFARNTFRRVPANVIKKAALTGLFGSFLPAFFFCIAQQKVESSMAGSLNSLTPIFVILMGVIFFKSHNTANQVLGILISFIGCILLFAGNPDFGMNTHAVYTLFIVMATLSYGLNVNLVNRFLKGVSSLDIAVVAFSFMLFPALIVLLFTGFFNRDFAVPGMPVSIFFSVLLGVLGTAIATVIFNMLIKRAGTIFASLVTYGIPVVANIWGVIYGERVGIWQLLCLLLILTGVYLATLKPRESRSDT